MFEEHSRSDADSGMPQRPAQNRSISGSFIQSRAAVDEERAEAHRNTTVWMQSASCTTATSAVRHISSFVARCGSAPGGAQRSLDARRRRHGRVAIACQGRRSWTWAATTISLLSFLFAVAGEDSYWINAAPAQVIIGQRISVAISGANFLVGASDYYCRFEATTIVNAFIGEFERRDSPLTILAHDSAVCNTPEWDLPATNTILKMVKSDEFIRKEGRQKSFHFLHALNGSEPASGIASGTQSITIFGNGFCPASSCPGALYTSSFSGSAGRQVTSTSCTVPENSRGQKVICQTPQWTFPAESTLVSLRKNGELIEGKRLMKYSSIQIYVSYKARLLIDL